MEYLSEEDLVFAKRFILASGSLKELARLYGVTYPTIRLRLDRLIEKIKLYEESKITSDFERALRAEYADGKLDLQSLKRILAAHNDEISQIKEQ